MSNNDSKKKNSHLGYLERYLEKKRNGGDTAILESLISGSSSSALTSIIYQPLELLKTRIQIQHDSSYRGSSQRILGRTIKSASSIIKEHGVMYLWRGTGAVSLNFSLANFRLLFTQSIFLLINFIVLGPLCSGSRFLLCSAEHSPNKLLLSNRQTQ